MKTWVFGYNILMVWKRKNIYIINKAVKMYKIKSTFMLIIMYEVYIWY